jgi:hypothetical protein
VSDEGVSATESHSGEALEPKPAIQYATFGARVSAFLVDVGLVWFWATAFMQAFGNVAPNPRVLGAFSLSALLRAPHPG